MHELTLRKTTFFDSDKSGTKNGCIDFIVSGQSLFELLKLNNKDLTGALGWTINIDHEIFTINTFLGLTLPELPSGRVCFYVCKECGDIGCGAINGCIEFSENVVIWKDFGFENGIDESDFNSYSNIGPFEFERSNYEQTFGKLKSETEAGLGL